MEYTKKLQFLFFLLSIIYTSLLFSQDTWAQTYRPFQQQYLTDRYSVEDILVTQDGGFVVSGSFELFDEFYYEHWGFLMKTDSDGNILWAVKDSVDFMSENGYNVDFTELQDGSFISIGYQGFGGNRYMIKRDANGNRLWAASFDTNFGVFSMQTTIDGNVILAGRSDNNAALRKITPDGNPIWTNIVDLESSIAYSVTQSNDGGYLLTGINYDENDILAIKTDANGDSLWTRTFPGLGGNDKGNCIIETSDENVIVVGEVHSRSIDTFVAKLSYDGSILWSNIYSELAACYTITQSQDSNLVGYSWGGASTNTTHLFKIDNNQDFIWNIQLNIWPTNGDNCFQELNNGSFICAGREHYGDNINLIKTNSQGQVDIIESEIVCLNDYLLFNYPNPFNPETKINFNLPYNVSNPIIEIFNTKGEKIRTFNCQNHMSIKWDGTDNYHSQVASGIYLYRLKTNHFVSKTKKMTLLK